MNDGRASMTLLYRSRDAMEASLLKGKLESCGIRVELSGGQGAIGFGELPADALRIDVWVPASRAAEAAQALTAFHESAARGGADGGADWTCGDCGESNGGSFELCWSCQGRRPA